MNSPSRKRRSFLVQDPNPGYALELIRRIYTEFGLRPVCFYSDAKSRYYTESACQFLTHPHIEASYVVTDFEQFARDVSERYEIAGIVTHTEMTVGPAARLCELLDIQWNPPEVIRRFRHKSDQKIQLREAGVRVPWSALIDSPEKLRQIDLPARYVLKPNDGYANVGIGIFDRDQVENAVRHMQSGNYTWLAEEFIGGPEFNINGQVRSDGRVEIFSIFEYRRRQVGQYQTVYDSEIQCASSHPRFQELQRYARAVLTATEIVRAPFHLEVKVDEKGPCMIDLACRLMGTETAHTTSRSHPGLPDLFSVAAHDYIDGGPPPPLQPINWQRHDQNLSMLVYGICETPGFLAGVDGRSEFEGWPEFVAWAKAPQIGSRIEPTTDLFSAPYIAEMRRPTSEQATNALIQASRSTLKLSLSRPGPMAYLQRIAARLSNIPRRLRWEIHRAISK